MIIAGKKYSSVFTLPTSLMLVIKRPILFSLPFDLQWKDLFSCRQKTVKEKFAEIKSFCPVVSLTWNKRKPSLHFSQNLQPGSPLQTLLFTLALAVTDSGKKQKETQIRIQNLGSKPPLKSKKGKHFCHVFKIWYCGKKPEVTSFEALFGCFCIWQEFVTCSASQLLACGFVKQWNREVILTHHQALQLTNTTSFWRIITVKLTRSL